VSIKTWSTPVEAEEKRTIPCALCGSRTFKPALRCEADDRAFAYVRCEKCGLVQMNPQPENKAVFRRYREGYGNDYLAYEIKNEASFLRLQELALQDAGWEKAKDCGTGARRALDIGCATGALLERLRGQGWTTAGVEISTPEARYAREKRGLDVRDRPLEQCGFSDRSFDVVLASHLIEHLNNPAGFCGEVYRVLAQGGLFFVTTPNIDGFQARLFNRGGIGRWRSAIFDHLYLFSIKTLRAMLEQQGFVVESVHTWGGIAAGAGPSWIKGPLDRLAKRFGFGDVMIMRGRKK
jgi:2-polyprenyl-3-methyl-5-hydroxy-6-metoxy-1,4-benzoquinol methylase